MIKVTGQPSIRFHSDGVLAVDDPPISPLLQHSDAKMASVSYSILLLFERTVTLTMPCSLLAGPCSGVHQKRRRADILIVSQSPF